MPGFVFDSSRPAQLHYMSPSPSSNYIPLQLFIFSEDDVARAVRAVRSRAFGNIEPTAFVVKTWTWANSYSTDSNVANVPTYVALFTSSFYNNYGGSSALALSRHI